MHRAVAVQGKPILKMSARPDAHVRSPESTRESGVLSSLSTESKWLSRERRPGRMETVEACEGRKKGLSSTTTSPQFFERDSRISKDRFAFPRQGLHGRQRGFFSRTGSIFIYKTLARGCCWRALQVSQYRASYVGCRGAGHSAKIIDKDRQALNRASAKHEELFWMIISHEPWCAWPL